MKSIKQVQYLFSKFSCLIKCQVGYQCRISTNLRITAEYTVYILPNLQHTRGVSYISMKHTAKSRAVQGHILVRVGADGAGFLKKCYQGSALVDLVLLFENKIFSHAN